jgi:hypothetical protein
MEGQADTPPLLEIRSHYGLTVRLDQDKVTDANIYLV